ncbi:MAG: hypothetical protein N3D12_03130 [Candidatus Methanomethyliaceae archaeon]|nr:hypothetical protein [Candidatus Methanomethyliaceae archaeon]
MKILVLGCEHKGRPLENLCRLDQDLRRIPDTCPFDDLHKSAKWCDILFIGSERNKAYMIADEIWHLLRGKPLISLTDGLPIKELRDLYPLSKVSRCFVYPDMRTEKALFLIALDNTFSHAEAATLKALLQSLGESLLVREDLLESLHSCISKSQEAINELLHILADSLGQDRDLFEYVIAWVLYGTGLAAIKGEELPSQDLKHVSPEIREGLRQFLKCIL